MRLHCREAQRSASEVGVFNGDVSWHLRGGAQALVAGMGVANAWLADQSDVSAPGKDYHGMGSCPEWAHGLHVCLYHSEGWTERNQQLLEMLSDEVRRCAGLWVIGGDFNTEPEAFEQFATPTRLPGILVAPTTPTFRHGTSVRRFEGF